MMAAFYTSFVTKAAEGRKKSYERWELFVVGMVGSFVGGAIFSWLNGGDLLATAPDSSRLAVHVEDLGQTVHIDGRNGVKVNKSRVTTADIMASNGVIHVIDKVILPN